MRLFPVIIASTKRTVCSNGKFAPAANELHANAELHLESRLGSCCRRIGQRKDVNCRSRSCMEAYGAVDAWIRVLLTSALVGGEWSASRFCRFTPEEIAPGTHWRGGWADPRIGLHELEK
jgi:hypothetical protein